MDASDGQMKLPPTFWTALSRDTLANPVPVITRLG
jgi:hypothetical protein